MSEEKSEQDSKSRNESRVILYLGTDDRFSERIQKRFESTYPAIQWDFQKMSAEDAHPELGIQSLFIDIVDLKPRVIYCDFSDGESKDFQFLIEIISRDNFFHNVPICGLVDKKEKTHDSICADVDLVFVKGAETFDLINTPMAIAFPKIVKPARFAKAKVSKKAKIADEFRLGYLTSSVIHIESNLPLGEGEDVSLQTDIPPKFVPSKKYKVKSQSASDLYYNFKYGYDMSYYFVDPPILQDKISVPDGDEENKIALIKKAREAREQAKNEYKGQVEWCQKKHKEWVLYNVNDVGQKGTKILIVDRKMRILKDESSGDIRDQPFGIRMQTRLTNTMSDIDRIRPILIVYQMYSQYTNEQQDALAQALEILAMPEDERPPRNLLAEDEEERLVNHMVEDLPDYIKNEQRYIGSLIKYVKTIENFKPAILIYNTHDTIQAKSLQQSYQYELISARNESIDLNSVTQLAGLLEKKRKEKHDKIIEKKIAVLKKSNPAKFRSLTPADFEERRYYIKKSNPLSFGKLESDIVIKAMTESELLFSTDLVLPLKSYRMTYPIPMSIYLVSTDGAAFIIDGDTKIYRALIHSIDENDKKKLREEVNKVFFEPLMLQREKEEAEYWRKHEEARNEREAEEEAEEEGEEAKEGESE